MVLIVNPFVRKTDQDGRWDSNPVQFHVTGNWLDLTLAPLPLTPFFFLFDFPLLAWHERLCAFVSSITLVTIWRQHLVLFLGTYVACMYRIYLLITSRQASSNAFLQPLAERVSTSKYIRRETRRGSPFNCRQYIKSYSTYTRIFPRLVFT